jgi:NAD(P)-dependent dehydrogenase (short-subunit alcohol dehydrogenase family)
MVVNEAFNRFIEENPGATVGMINPLPVELLDVSDVSKAIVFLCSEDGQYITGVTLPVDGGICNK